MALTPNQLQSIIDLVRRDPEARRQLQAALQIDPLLGLPSRVDRLDEKLERVAEMLAELTSAHLRAQSRLEGVEDRLARVEARLEGVEDRLARAEARLEGVEDRLTRVEARLEGVEDRLARAEARLEGVEDRLTRVEARLEGVEERLTRLEQTVQKLADAQVAMQEQLATLTGEVRKVSTWQFGDEGRRKGEQYQRKIELQALRLLGEGQGGGLARDRVYERINQLLARLPDLDLLDDESDPTLADVIWWKGDHYAVVEVSLRVDRLDVLRAARRAETLRQSGVEALGVVIGEDWIADDTEILARENDVAWKVGADISPALITFRQRTAADPGSQQP